MYVLNHLNKLCLLFLICSVNLFSQNNGTTILGVTSVSNPKSGGVPSILDVQVHLQPTILLLLAD